MTASLPPWLLLAAPVLCGTAWSQDTEPASSSETVVTASRAERPSDEAPQTVSVIDAEEIAQRSYRTLPQSLRHTPGVLVQETSHGQGSPYIRGFTGYRTLLLVDGVRINNSTFREGPNQYWSTVDAFSVERFELLRGPSSALYGSDAIGGTLQVFSRDPFATDGRPAARIGYRLSSAENSHVGRFEASAVEGPLGVVLGVTAKQFGDVHGGSDIGDQPNTGYDEWDADAKLEYWLRSDQRLVVGFQHVTQNDVPRTHSTIYAKSFEGSSVGSDLRRDLDQERQLVRLQLDGESIGTWVDAYSFGLSLQRQSEVQDRIRSSTARTVNGFDVTTLGGFARFEKQSSIGLLSYGIDVYHDSVDSFSDANPIQGPVADDASYDLIGAYVQDEFAATERLDVTVGARFEHAAADADRVDDPANPGTAIAIDDQWSSLVGSARFLYRVNDAEEAGTDVALYGGVSQGYRAPNLSDLSRFDSARSNEFEIPAPDLDAERFTTFELGTRVSNESTRGELAVFYTDISDQIERFPTGNTNGSGEFEITKDNIGDGWIYGVELTASHELGGGFGLFGNATFQEGRVTTYPTSAQVLTEEYVSRLMPLTAQVGLRWEDEETGTWSELLAIGAADADKLSTRDKGDTQRIPPGGTPGFVVVHARAGMRLGEATDLMLAVENLTDEDYRFHGSGSNQPGLGVLLGITVTL
ncbi:Colicin I receptor precursor [Planctomycetes bacterium Pla163]|uniref:Colicin I receptor n=1 Tax=Rohdeia mirabilis TaxID=2528008 RepID=A0A518CWS9_9BACT|nr:Colicin I receptor precursor [Planctomycetes bacterium Pla163]